MGIEVSILPMSAAVTVNSAYNELLGTMINSSLYPEFVITI